MESDRKKMEDHRLLKDADIREPLFDYLEQQYGKIRILEEKVTGRARADVVMILPDQICGIEIKSDADTYTRLPSQVKNYDRYYDRNIIVAGSRHAAHIEKHVPDYWGIITVEWLGGEVDFYPLREPERNPNMQWDRKLSLLWREELTRILIKNGLPKYSRTSKKNIAKRLLERVPEEILGIQICEELFERDYTLFDEGLR